MSNIFSLSHAINNTTTVSDVAFAVGGDTKHEVLARNPWGRRVEWPPGRRLDYYRASGLKWCSVATDG
jgi:hypothetical protein